MDSLNIQLTGAQVLGFLAVLLVVGPALIYFGKLMERVTKHERMIATLFDKMASIDEKLMERIDQVESRLAKQIADHGYNNCPMLDTHRSKT